MGCAQSRILSRRLIWKRDSPFFSVLRGIDTPYALAPDRPPCSTTFPLFALITEQTSLFLQCTDISHQALNLFRLQLISVLWHLGGLAVGDDRREIRIRFFLHRGAREIVTRHFRAVGAMAHGTF